MHVAGKMLGQSEPRGEHQPLSIDSAGGGLAAQVRARGGGGRREPQHAAGNARKQAHPDIEYRRQDLVARVEAAEHYPLLGQTARRPRRRERGDRTLRIARTVAVGQIQETLGEERLQLGRGSEAIGEHVVVPGCPQRTQITQPAHLHRRGLEREELALGMCRVAIQINQHLDPVLRDTARDLLDSLVAAIDEAVERSLDTDSQGGRLRWADRVCMCRHACPVVSLPDLSEERCRGVRTEIRRYVTHA